MVTTNFNFIDILTDNLSGATKNTFDKLAQMGISDITITATPGKEGRVEFRRGCGDFQRETWEKSSRYLVLAIVESTLGAKAAEDLAQGNAQVSGQFEGYRISGISEPYSRSVTVVTRLA